MMMMKEINPAVAARVWQRVQKAATPCEEKPACPLEGIAVVPAVQNVPEKKCVRRCNGSNHGIPVWLLPVLLWALMGS